MAKNRDKIINSRKQICIPKCCQQPRSHGSKPRTDFSLFFSDSFFADSSFLRGGYGVWYIMITNYILRRRINLCLAMMDIKFWDFYECVSQKSDWQGAPRLELISEKYNISSSTSTSMDRCCQTLLPRHDEMSKFTLVQCDISHIGETGGISSNSFGMKSTETESHQEALLDACNDRIYVHNNSEDAAELFDCPNKCTSDVTECSDVQTTPGTIMWARTAHQMWWPAKIVVGRSAFVATNDQSAGGHVLVQYYGNHELAWVDPAGDLSEFDECFEERSCNPLEAFQDALKQALHKKEALVYCGRMTRSPHSLQNSSNHDQCGAQSNKWNESSSSREENKYQENRRGKRMRKPKVHFDEVTFPKKSMKKMRRLKIMRFLGLTAPSGSPFSLTSGLRDR